MPLNASASIFNRKGCLPSRVWATWYDAWAYLQGVTSILTRPHEDLLDCACEDPDDDADTLFAGGPRCSAQVWGFCPVKAHLGWAFHTIENRL